MDLNLNSDGDFQEFKSKYIYLNKSLDTRVLKDTDACPTKENNTTMKHCRLKWTPPAQMG